LARWPEDKLRLGGSKVIFNYENWGLAKITVNVKLLNELFESRYIDWINKSIGERGAASRFMFEVGKISKIGGLLRKMGYSDSKLKAYNAYLTLKPIELLIEKRNRS